MALRVTLAGRVGIEVDGGEVAAGGLGRPGRLALTYLTCARHRPVTRDELAEVLWGEELPRSWEQMVRGVAFKLRGLLSAAGLDPAQALTTTGGAYRLHLPPDATVDVEEAAATVEAAEASLAAGYAGAARAGAQAALTTAARSFAPTLTGAWVERRQAELGELALRARQVLAEAALAEGDWAGAIAAAEEVIAAQAFRESAYLCLMDAHAGAGNRGEALRAYERCREVLVEELGVDPSPPTEAAYLRLLGDEPALVETSAAALPLPPALAPVPGSFLVGREAEVEALEAAIKRAGVEGRQGMLVGGEPGAGKTTLVAAAARAAHHAGARVLYGRCDEELALAYGPFAQALGHYVATAPTAELKAHVAASGGTLARLVPELGRRLPEAVPPPATDAEADRWALFQAVSDVLARAAAASTVVVVLDDLHWAAPGTLALLRHLLAEPSATAVAVLGTFRSTEAGADCALGATLAELRRAPAVERINLLGLDADGVAAFVAMTGAAGEDDDVAALARAVHAHTAGNPFFVGELLRHLAETGATYRRSGSWSYYAEAGGVEVPDGVVEVVRRRVGRLSADANRALVLASVAGAEFDIEVVERADPEHSATVLDGLDEAQAASLVVELERPGSYRFAHALVRHALYGNLSRARRARLHLRIGEAIESLPGDHTNRLAALAHHFAAAAPTSGAAKAADYALAAAEHALSLASYEEAAFFLERGVGAVDAAQPPDHQRRAELLLLLAKALFADRRNQRGTEVARLATEAALAGGTDDQLAEAAFLRSFIAPASREPAVTELIQTALDRLGNRRPDLRAPLLVVRKPWPEMTDELFDEGLTLARACGDQTALISVLEQRWFILLGTPRAAELLAAAEELVAVERTGQATHGFHPFGGLHPASLDKRAAARLVNGDRRGFDADVEELDRLARTTRSRSAVLSVARWRVVQALMDGRFDQVPELAERSDDAHGPSVPRGRHHALLCWEQGRSSEMVEVSARLVAALPEAAHLRARLAMVEALHGDEAAARLVLAELTDELHRLRKFERLTTVAHLAEAAAALGADAASAALYEAMLPYANQVVAGMTVCCLGSVDRHLGMLAGVLKRWDEAAAHFDRALAIDAALRAPPLLARTQYWYAHLLTTCPGGDQARAVELAGAARSTTAALGMATLTAQIGELFDAVRR